MPCEWTVRIRKCPNGFIAPTTPAVCKSRNTTSLFSIAEKVDVHHNDEGLVSSSALLHFQRQRHTLTYLLIRTPPASEDKHAL